MSPREFVATARLYWKTFAAVTLTVLAVGMAWVILTPVQYVSTAQLLVAVQGSSTANAYQNDDVVIGRVRSFVVLLTSDVVAQRVIDHLGLSLTPAELKAKISAVNVPPSTAVIDVAVTDSSPERAREIADAVAAEFVEYTQALEAPTGEDTQQVKTTVVSGASQPKSRLVERIGLAGLIAGFAAVLGVVAVWIRSMTDPVVRTPQQAASATGVPILGDVGPGLAKSLAELQPYRHLRTRLLAETDAGPLEVLQIAALDGNVDVRQVAFNLARAMSMGSDPYVVVDATIGSDGSDNRPDGVPNNVWLVSPEEVSTKDSPTSLERLRDDYGRALIATQSPLASPVASAVSDYADAVLLVACLGTTDKRSATRSADELRATGGPLLGVVSTTCQASTEVIHPAGAPTRTRT